MQAILNQLVRRLELRGLVALQLILMATLAACGGGGGGGGGSPPAPTEITAQPVSVDVVTGAAANFSISARGDELRYQWQISVSAGTSWADIAGATAAAYTVAAVNAAMSGQQYRVSVSGAAGSILSSAATLSVRALAAPVITVEPTDQTVVAGAGTSFSVTASGTSLSYQWQTGIDASSWSDVPSGSAATLPVATVAGGAAERFFRVVVGNSVGSLTSRAARLTVRASSSAPTITTQPSAVSVVAPAPATFTVVASGTPAPGFQWQVSSNNGSSYADITGATAASHTLATTSTADSGKVFRVLLSNSAGQVFSTGVMLSVAAAGIAPAFTLQPLNQSVTAPGTATFTVAVTGSPTPTLQWQISSDAGVTFTNIVGATASSYTTPATGAGDNGRQFRAVASNSAGSATSLAATLAVSSGGLLGFPYGVSVDAAGTLAVAVLPNVQTGTNTFAGLIQLVSAGGAVSTLAGSTTQGYVNASGGLARFFAAVGVASDGSGNVFVADSGNNVVRRVTAAGAVTTYAGSGVVGFADGPAGTASFFGPNGVAVDGAGNVYVADGGWHTVRMVSAGSVSTLAGSANNDGAADGVGVAARFDSPRGVAVDGAGNVYVADTGNNSIRKVTPAGTVTTLAGGLSASGGFQDGAGSVARFSAP